MTKSIVILLSSFILLSCGQKKNPEQETTKITVLNDSLTTKLNEIHQQGHINGFGVAIVNAEGIRYKNGIGMADTKAAKKYTSHTVQNIGSVSKTLIGIALLKAQEMGKLDLDDPIENHLPFKVTNPYYPQEKITIRHLATHTSTITDTDFYNAKAYILKSEAPDLNANLSELNENFNPPDSRIPMKDFLQKILHEKGEWYQKEGFTTHKPGQIFEYSNIGATLAALILEIAVGEPYDEFTAKHILKPLKMSSSGWSFEHIDMTNHSKLYANPETEIPFYSLITYPDGGLITNIEDLGKYLMELIKGYYGEGTLLQDESYKELFSEQLQPESFPERDEKNAYNDEYNTGIFMGFTPKGYIGHTGGDPGIGTYMFFNPKTKLGRILVINTSIINAEGVKEFFSVWKTLEEFETEFDKTGS